MTCSSESSVAESPATDAVEIAEIAILRVATVTSSRDFMAEVRSALSCAAKSLIGPSCLVIGPSGTAGHADLHSLHNIAHHFTQ